MDEERLKAIEEELAYLRKIIEEMTKNCGDNHYHYTTHYHTQPTNFLLIGKEDFGKGMDNLFN